MKKLLSIILCIIILLSVIPSAFALNVKNKYPIIEIDGRDNDWEYVDADGNKIHPVSFDSSILSTAVSECVPLFAKALVTNNYQPWIDKVLEFYEPYFKDFVPDKNGDVTDGSHRKEFEGFACLKEDPANRFRDYCFTFDWRLSPLVVADYLDFYIQQIKKTTGCSQVSIMARCYGCNVLSAYLYKYGHEDIHAVIYSASSAMGCVGTTSFFSGEVALDPVALEKYLDASTSLTGDAITDELIISTVKYLNSFYGMNLTAAQLNALVKQIYPKVAPELLKVSYARYSSLWAMVAPEKYEKAKALVFSGCEEEYSGLIAKNDEYYRIQLALPDLLKRYHEEGMLIAVVARYGSEDNYPIYQDALKQNDGMVFTSASSFGAVCADTGKTLTAKQLEGADSRYISPDRVINSSTCLFPDYTWFVKNYGHARYTAPVIDLFLAILNSDEQITNSSYTKLPTFSLFTGDENSLSEVPAVAEDTDSDSLKARFESFFAFFRNIAATFRRFVNALNAFVQARK